MQPALPDENGQSSWVPERNESGRSSWILEGSLAGYFRPGFPWIFCRIWPPLDPPRLPGPAPHINLHGKSNPQTNSKAKRRRTTNPARLPSGTQSRGLSGLTVAENRAKTVVLFLPWSFCSQTYRLLAEDGCLKAVSRDGPLVTKLSWDRPAGLGLRAS